jgi:hypothetical protein
VRWTALVLALAACSLPPHHGASDAGIDGAVDVDAPVPPDAPPVMVTITSTVDSTRFVTREHMLAAGEMQISGEPLAEAMGRDLTGYSRNLVPPDVYIDPRGVYGVDLPGFSTAIESYEYSKQPMNMLAFESGAGTTLDVTTARIQRFAEGANAFDKWVFTAGTFPTGNIVGDVNPTGAGTAADNPLGWPGMVPTEHVFASFDPAIDPTSAEDLQCSIASDDNPNEQGGALISADYECSAVSLHLRDRAAQIDPTITPGADGFTTWKYALWVINYLQIMHDGMNRAVDSVPDADLAQVGVPHNTAGGPTGTYLGSSDVEGFQAAMFITMLDARADDWLMHLTTTDGTTLSGFATLQDALAYDYAAPLRWFPGRLAVTESPALSYAIAAPKAELFDSLGVLLGYATAYALTDQDNRDVGGSQPCLVYFDGDPFNADDGAADGEPTLHDRALAMIRVALIDLDRMHAVGDVFADSAGGHTIATTSAAYTVIALRTVQRGISSQLELYSNNTPDTAIGVTPLDALAIHYPGAPALTFSQRVSQLERAHADLLLDKLTDASGRAYAGWDLAANTPTTTDDTLDAHTAAIRGLMASYLATGDTRYRDRAIAVFDRIEHVFYDGDARVYGSSPAPVATVTYTPLRFALLQSALRDIYELVAARPGGEMLEPVLEARIGRLDKLVLNGWDDRDRDKHITWPAECTNVVGGLPRGGLQMAERTLSGETGRLVDEIGGNMGPPTSDRESDCVPEIDDAHLPAALADSITLTVTRP